jgi:energy-converting hydrogenase Eha subunit A
MNKPAAQKKDTSVYVLGVGLGISAGFLDLLVGDLLATALFVLISTLILGMLRPPQPWRWTIVVGLFVPLIRLGAWILFKQKPYRAQLYESALGFVTGIAGAYGGAVVRRGVQELFGK